MKIVKRYLNEKFLDFAENDYGKLCDIYINPTSSDIRILCKDNKLKACRGLLTKTEFFAFDFDLIHAEFLKLYLSSDFSKYLTKKDYDSYIQAFFKDKDVSLILNVPINYNEYDKTWSFESTTMTTQKTIELVREFLDTYWSNFFVYM